MSEPAHDTSRSARVIFGLVLVGVGLLNMYGMLSRPTEGPGRPRGEWLIIFGPMLIVGGGVICVRGIRAGGRIFSSRTVLYTGLVMLAIGGFPWLYTGLLIRDRGGEGSGMLGTLLFILVGIPGLILTLVGLALRVFSRE